MPLQPESDLELNINDIERLLIFPTIICTPRYNKQFSSYDFLKLTRLLKFCPGQNKYPTKFELLTPNRMQSQETFNINIVANFLDGYLCATIGSTIQEL
jgi:hypothetical protein